MPAPLRYRKPRELAHTRLGRHAMVEASAGTGKTSLLEPLVVELLLARKAKLEQILVVTFSEKATAELVVRLRAKLRELRELRPESAGVRTGAGAPDEEPPWAIFIACCEAIHDIVRHLRAGAL